jgi:hypothetical protein
MEGFKLEASIVREPGVMAIPKGCAPTEMVATKVLVAVSMTEMVLVLST